MTDGTPVEPADKRSGTPTEDGAPKGCLSCGGSLAGKRHDAKYCSNFCRNKWWRTAEVRGAQVYQLLIEWRTTRGNRKGVLGDIAHVVDKWISEDRDKNRGDGGPDAVG